jgi:hypothetical protein
MIPKPVKSALAAAAVAMAACSPAVAQMRPGMGGPGMMDGYGPGWHMWGGPGWWGGPDAMVSRIDGRLAFLRAELKITDAQKEAWDKVAAAVRASATSMAERMKTLWSSEPGAKSLPERLDLQEKFAVARLDEIRQLKAAMTGLYAVLNEEQKKEADHIVLPMMGMGMMDGHWGPGPGMWRR